MLSQELARAFNFVVFINEKKVPFRRVSGIEMVMETESVSEGGVNSKKRESKKEGKSQNMLKLERALPLKLTEEQKFTVGQTLEKDVSIYLKDEVGICRKAFHFTGCTISRLSLDDMDATRSDVLIQRVEIRFQNMEEEDL